MIARLEAHNIFFLVQTLYVRSFCVYSLYLCGFIHISPVPGGSKNEVLRAIKIYLIFCAKSQVNSHTLLGGINISNIWIFKYKGGSHSCKSIYNVTWCLIYWWNVGIRYSSGCHSIDHLKWWSGVILCRISTLVGVEPIYYYQPHNQMVQNNVVYLL